VSARSTGRRPQPPAGPDRQHPETRRRRPRWAILGGGVLIATSPVAVAAGQLVVGFGALALGGALLLLPPRQVAPPGHGRRLAVGRALGAADRVAASACRAVVRAGGSALRRMERLAANEGRATVAAAGRAVAAGAGAAWRFLLIVAAMLAHVTWLVARWAHERGGPTLASMWRASAAACRRAARELGALVRATSHRVATVAVAASRSDALRPLRPRAPRPRSRGSSGPGRRARAPRPDSRTRADRSRRSPPSSP
jgi:hypothetical protein